MTKRNQDDDELYMSIVNIIVQEREKKKKVQVPNIPITVSEMILFIEDFLRKKEHQEWIAFKQSILLQWGEVENDTEIWTAYMEWRRKYILISDRAAEIEDMFLDDVVDQWNANHPKLHMSPEYERRHTLCRTIYIKFKN
jgi:hypothetical protein